MASSDAENQMPHSARLVFASSCPGHANELTAMESKRKVRAKPCLGQEQGKIQGNLDFEMESHALCLTGADFSGSLVRSLTKNNRESNFDNREVHSPRTGKNC